MPLPYLKKIGATEGQWEKAKAIAAKAGHAENYAYITGIVKKMVGVEEDEGRIKLIRDLIAEIKSGKIDADEAASTLLEMVSSGSVGGFIAGGFVQGYKGTPFPTGTRDQNGIPRKPSWGNAAEQKSAKNLPGRKHHKKRKRHRRA